MTKRLVAALAVLMIGLPGGSQAIAGWTCSGPDYVCGGKRQAGAGKTARTRQAARKARPSARSKSGGSTGVASYYWQGKRTASGARFNPGGLTAAHRSLPFGTRVRVTNLNNGRSVTVTINDRGPFIKGRVIDLSRGAASVIGMTGSGVARVSYAVVGRG